MVEVANRYVPNDPSIAAATPKKMSAPMGIPVRKLFVAKSTSVIRLVKKAPAISIRIRVRG